MHVDMQLFLGQTNTCLQKLNSQPVKNTSKLKLNQENIFIFLKKFKMFDVLVLVSIHHDCFISCSDGQILTFAIFQQIISA